jgi:hypothetical protein
MPKSHRTFSIPDYAVVGSHECKEFARQFQVIAEERLRYVMKNREEIIEAYVAKNGFQPEDTIQYEQRRADGTTVWFVGKRVKDGECPACGRTITPDH